MYFRLSSSAFTLIYVDDDYKTSLFTVFVKRNVLNKFVLIINGFQSNSTLVQ